MHIIGIDFLFVFIQYCMSCIYSGSKTVVRLFTNNLQLSTTLNTKILGPSLTHIRKLSEHYGQRILLLLLGYFYSAKIA